MFWNHRVVKITEGDETQFVLAEVYYRDDTKLPFAYSEPFMCGEHVSMLVETVERFKKATEQPILNYPEDFDLSEQDEDEDNFEADDDTPVAPV
jgi:hypothetical protein